ncbi:MAG: UDP-galactopyranose mutase, partial [Pseudobutyrivibrio sp.]|nr:UDP-galactopyranose mutase [Pseudobutyrivibrio sp.]
FNDRFQGIPMGGYTQIVEKMLEGSDVALSQDYFDMVGGVKNAKGATEGTLKDGTEVSWNKLIFTGQIDEYYDSCFGPLEYRSVRFETEKLNEENYQGNAVVNYTEAEVPYTRIIEHKHFEFGKQPTTIISREYSSEWKPGVEPYYPVNNDKNNAVYQQYANKANTESNVVFGGRLGQYKYYDMDKVVAAALECVAEEF